MKVLLVVMPCSKEACRHKIHYHTIKGVLIVKRERARVTSMKHPGIFFKQEKEHMKEMNQASSIPEGGKKLAT